MCVAVVFVLMEGERQGGRPELSHCSFDLEDREEEEQKGKRKREKRRDVRTKPLLLYVV